MASPSSSTSRNVFVSFHGPDVNDSLLSLLREQFICNGITIFNDQETERSATIAQSHIEVIRESRISIVILSVKYASSSWCMDELVKILECKNTMGQIVMPIFYDVYPSEVRNHTGEFGSAFDENCAHKTNEEREKWSKALIDVGNIAGVTFFKWDNESKLIKKIAIEVSNKLYATPSRCIEKYDGVQIWADKTEWNHTDRLICESDAKKFTECWSFLPLCLDLSQCVISIACGVCGTI